MSSSKKTTETSTSTTTPNTPDWLAQPWQDFAGNVGKMDAQNPYQVVGASPLQTQAFDQAAHQSVSPYFQQGADLITQAANGGQPAAQATASTAAQYLGQYANPYMQQVIQPMLRTAGQQLGIAQNAVGQNAQLAGGYGGSRQGIAQGLTNQDWLNTTEGQIGQLLSSGYTSALGAGAGDAERATNTSQFNAGAVNQNNQFQQGLNLNAGTALGNMGASSGAQRLQQLGLLGDLGAQQQALDQATANPGWSNAAIYAGLLGAIPSNLFVGSTTNASGTGKTTGGGLLDTLGKVGQIAAQVGPMIAASDARLKRDVTTAGYDAKGRRWVDFNYTWDAPDAPPRRGVIAQEVQRTDPDAVGMPPNGFLMVDYGKLEG